MNNREIFEPMGLFGFCTFMKTLEENILRPGFETSLRTPKWLFI